MVTQLLVSPTSSWFELNEVYYRKEERYNLIWKKINIENYNLTIGKNSGLLALIRNPGKLALSQVDDHLSSSCSIYTLSGKLLNTIKWEKGKLIDIGWVEDQLICIYLEGIIRVYTIFGQYTQFSLGLSSSQFVKQAKCWKRGIVILTNDDQFLTINNVNEPRIKKLPLNELNDIVEWDILEPKLELANQIDIFFCHGNTIYSIDDNNIIDQRLEQGPFTHISISPNGSFLCLINNNLTLMVVSTDFQQKFTEVELTNQDLPQQTKWCGNDLILLNYGNELQVIGPFGHNEKFYYDSNIFISSEIDGANIISDYKLEFIQKVPDSSLNIFNIGSTHPSSLLFDALDHFEKENPKADETMNMIQNDLELAVNICLDSASQEWEPSLQKALLKAAAFGKSYLDNYDSDKFAYHCKLHRIINQVRQFDIGIPITMEQLKLWKIENLIKRLLLIHQHYLALKITQFLNLNCNDILIDWACEKLRNSLEDEETTSRIILDKISNYQGLSYHKIAKVANQNGQLQLAINLLDKEPCIHFQIPMLLDMQEDQLALNKAVLSGESYLVYLVLLQLKQKLNIGDFFKLINPNLIGSECFENYCKVENEDLLKDFYYQDDQKLKLILLKLKNTFNIKDFEEFELKWKELLKDYKNLITKSEDTKLVEEQIKLLNYQNQLKEKVGQSIMGSSLAETIKLATRYEEYSIVNKIQKEFKVNEKMYYYCKIQGYILGNHFVELEKFANSKKSPIGYKPFYDLTLKAQQPSQALKYALLCDPKIRPNLLLNLNAFLDAAKQAFINKDKDMLNTIRDKCTNPSMKQEIDTLIIKLGGN
ncbi:hypothetical protein K502DRAFT_325777 [Neoconidiobolus thromboides FSU 785]|nr:hypothetical protein K502DRAFT_325777 [Neoconidiobolus thromboides FSU 785]